MVTLQHSSGLIPNCRCISKKDPIVQEDSDTFIVELFYHKDVVVDSVFAQF